MNDGPVPDLVGTQPVVASVQRRGRFAYVKGNLERVGLGHVYHDVWWQLAARRRSPLTAWNYANGAVFIHIPKTAGLSIYEMFGMTRPYDTHAPVAGYRAADPALFARAFKFAVVRNPWDRLVSAFHYLKFPTAASDSERWSQDAWWSERYLSGIDSFPAFMQALRMARFRNLVLTWRHFIPQHYFVTVGKSGLLVDRLVRFESLGQGLRSVAERIDVPMSTVKRNASKHVDYRSYYDDADIAFVGQLYARDIALFGYTFSAAGPLG